MLYAVHLGILLATNAPAQAAFDQLPDLERSIVASREKIRSGTFEYRSVYTLGKLRNESVFTVLFNETQSRMDTKTSRTGAGTSEERTQSSFGAEAHFSFLEASALGEGPSHKELRVIPRGGLLEKTVRSNAINDTIDPRLVGTHPMSFLNLGSSRLGDLLEPQGRVDRRVERVELDGRPCLKLSFQYRPPIRWAYWVDPERDHIPLRIELQFQGDDGKAIVDRLSVEPKQYQPSGIWYPARTLYSRTIDGVEIETEELITLKAAINEDPGKDAFELAALAIPDGTRVSDFRKDAPVRSGVWRDGRIVPVKRDFPLPPEEAARGPAMPWLLGSLALLGLGMPAAVVAFRRLRPKRAA
jgi:hypothetical protein